MKVFAHPILLATLPRLLSDKTDCLRRFGGNLQRIVILERELNFKSYISLGTI